jgi:hypothetical protein
VWGSVFDCHRLHGSGQSLSDSSAGSDGNASPLPTTTPATTVWLGEYDVNANLEGTAIPMHEDRRGDLAWIDAARLSLRWERASL